jgi:hypothetical protein
MKKEGEEKRYVRMKAYVSAEDISTHSGYYTTISTIL